MTLPDMSLLGWRVKDKLTGYTGIVQGYIQYYGGVIQADVQAVNSEPNKIEQGYYFDLFQLETVGEAPALTDLPKHNPLVANLGDEAVDTITGFKGKVTDIKWYLNGCTKYTLSTKVTATSKPGDQLELSILEARVKVTKPVETATKKAKTGGPTVPSKRF